VSERHPPVIDERTYQRRRLGVLAGLLALVLAAAPFVGGPGGQGAGDVEVATGDQVVRIAAAGSPTAIRELLSETTTTLVEATGATTTTAPTTTAAPATTVAAPTTAPARDADEAEPVADAEPARAPAVADDEPEPTATTRAPATTAPPTTAAPAPKPAPTTTTTAPARTTEEGYAYDDPRSTQVWYDLARCESGGNWSIDTGNGYYGGLQFSLPTWESVGGTGYPHEHPAATQIEMGRRLQARQGWGAWPHCSEELGLR